MGLFLSCMTLWLFTWSHVADIKTADQIVGNRIGFQAKIDEAEDQEMQSLGPRQLKMLSLKV